MGRRLARTIPRYVSVLARLNYPDFELHGHHAEDSGCSFWNATNVRNRRAWFGFVRIFFIGDLPKA
jgi:hypothetical protein